MMPPEGTVLHWFLTNRSIHVWITMVSCIRESGNLENGERREKEKLTERERERE